MLLITNKIAIIDNKKPYGKNYSTKKKSKLIIN